MIRLQVLLLSRLLSLHSSHFRGIVMWRFSLDTTKASLVLRGMLCIFTSWERGHPPVFFGSRLCHWKAGVLLGDGRAKASHELVVLAITDTPVGWQVV